MSSRTVSIINALYGKELRSSWTSRLRSLSLRLRRKVEVHRRERRILDFYRERNKVLTRGRIIVGIVVVLVVALVSTSFVYFNRLTTLEQDVYMEQAKIASLLQRRRNITINLARTVRDYAAHEQAIFHHVSDVRSSSSTMDRSLPGERGIGESHIEVTQADRALAGSATTVQPPGGDAVLEEVLSLLEGSRDGDVPLEKKLSGLVAVAESYPDLRLSENFRRFMDALVETERDISDRRMHYSDVVNSYSTQLRTYPGRLFAFMYGFEPVPYFEADSEAVHFHPVEY